MEITHKIVTETHSEPQHGAVFDFDQANPTEPVAVTHTESPRFGTVAEALHYLISHHWHDVLLLAAGVVVAITLTTPLRLGTAYPLAAIPPSSILVFFIGVGFMTRGESKILTAWIAFVCMTASGYLAAGMELGV